MFGKDVPTNLAGYLRYGVYQSLAEKDPETAAKEFDRYVENNLSLNPRKTLEDLVTDINSYMFLANLVARCNGVENEMMDNFISSTDYVFGIRLNKLTGQNRIAGLRAGDLIVAINGHLFCNPQHARLLLHENPDATLTYLRDGEQYTTETIKDPHFTGDYIVQKR